MKNCTKKLVLLFLISVFIFSALSIVWAEEKPTAGRLLDVKYPSIAGTETPRFSDTDITDYVRYIYNFIIGISGLLAFGVLITGGLGYIMSSGSPEKMKDARDKIFAAFLGILILFGSWILLYNINPDLTKFNLARLRPIISELTPGVLLCKDAVGVQKAWDFQQEFKRGDMSEEREKEIKVAMELYLKKISEACYTVSTSGNIKDSFDNEIKFIYFIPHLAYKYKQTSDEFVFDPDNSHEYGAVVYNGRNYKEESIAIVKHLEALDGEIKVYAYYEGFEKISSIKPFMLNYNPNPGWNVTLYEDYDLNDMVFGVGVGGPQQVAYYLSGLSGPFFGSIDDMTCRNGCATNDWDCDSIWRCKSSLGVIPRSMKIEGDLLVVLKTAKGRSETFTEGTYNNLENYINIVDVVPCREYDSKEKYETLISSGGGGMGGGGSAKVSMCHKPAATEIYIISGHVL